MTLDRTMWLGTEESLSQVLQAGVYAINHPEKAEAVASLFTTNGIGELPDDDDDDHDMPEFESELIQVEGTIGIINVSGPMVAEDSWVNSFFGIVSYPEISRALVELAETAQISSILINLDTGGGPAGGLEAVSETVAWAREYKDVHAHTSGGMLSAGYWIGSSANSISSTRMGETGSIGVVISHQSVYEYLKDKGIEYTIIRAGKYKALGHPSEKLSEEAKALLEEKADALYNFFLEHVITNRAALGIATKDSWAEGKTFFGEEAQQLGLVDEVTTLSTRIEKLANVDKLHQASDNTSKFASEETTMPQRNSKVVLKSKEDKAALASGVPLEDVESEVVTDEATPETTAGAEGVATTAEASAEGSAAEPAADDKPAAGGEASGDTSLVSYLQEQNSSLSTQVATLTAKLETAKSKLTNLDADVSALREIAVQSMCNMQVPLGSAPIDMSGLPASTVVAQHAKVREAFEAKFSIGQKSRAVAERTEGDDVAPAARLGIVRKT